MKVFHKVGFIGGIPKMSPTFEGAILTSGIYSRTCAWSIKGKLKHISYLG